MLAPKAHSHTIFTKSLDVYGLRCRALLLNTSVEQTPMVKPRKIAIQCKLKIKSSQWSLGYKSSTRRIKPESEFLGQVEHAEATARQGAMIAMAGPMAAAMLANMEYNRAIRLNR